MSPGFWFHAAPEKRARALGEKPSLIDPVWVLINKGPSRETRIGAKNTRKKPNRPSTASFQTPRIGSLRKKDASTPASAPAAIANSPQTSKKKIVKPGGTA